MKHGKQKHLNLALKNKDCNIKNSILGVGKYFCTEFTEGFKTIEGFSDCTEVECMGFQPFVICPHYNLDGYKEKMDLMIEEFRPV